VAGAQVPLTTVWKHNYNRLAFEFRPLADADSHCHDGTRRDSAGDALLSA
jgi:hypothetical protein